MTKKKFLIAVKIQHEALFEVMAENMEDAEDIVQENLETPLGVVLNETKDIIRYKVDTKGFINQLDACDVDPAVTEKQWTNIN